VVEDRVVRKALREREEKQTGGPVQIPENDDQGGQNQGGTETPCPLGLQLRRQQVATCQNPDPSR